MSYEPGYCPWCGQELHVEAIEAFSQNLIWSKCGTKRCHGNLKRNLIKTDNDGFILDPLNARGWYLFKQKITYEY